MSNPGHHENGGENGSHNVGDKLGGEQEPPRDDAASSLPFSEFPHEHEIAFYTRGDQDDAKKPRG